VDLDTKEMMGAKKSENLTTGANASNVHGALTYFGIRELAQKEEEEEGYKPNSGATRARGNH